MSRVDAADAIKRCHLDLQNTVVPDAFFPFRDGLDVCAKAGAGCCPTGRVGAVEVIEAANEHGIAMVLTGARHFRH